MEKDKDMICDCGHARSAHKQKLNPDRVERISRFYVTPCYLVPCACKQFNSSMFLTEVRKALKRSKRKEWQEQQGEWNHTPEGIAYRVHKEFRRKR